MSSRSLSITAQRLSVKRRRQLSSGASRKRRSEKSHVSENYRRRQPTVKPRLMPSVPSVPLRKVNVQQERRSEEISNTNRRFSRTWKMLDKGSSLRERLVSPSKQSRREMSSSG